MLEFTQERSRVRRVHDDQFSRQFGPLIGKVPCHRSTPVVRYQAVKRRRVHCAALVAGLGVDQCSNIPHQLAGPVRAGFGRGARSLETAQVGGYAAIRTVRRRGEMLQQGVPHERSFRKAMQKHENRPPKLSRSPATECDAVRQILEKCVDHGGEGAGRDGRSALGFGVALPSGCTHCHSSWATSSTPLRLGAEKSMTCPPPA